MSTILLYILNNIIFENQLLELSPKSLKQLLGFFEQLFEQRLFQVAFQYSVRIIKAPLLKMQQADSYNLYFKSFSLVFRTLFSLNNITHFPVILLFSKVLSLGSEEFLSFYNSPVQRSSINVQKLSIRSRNLLQNCSCTSQWLVFLQEFCNYSILN